MYVFTSDFQYGTRSSQSRPSQFLLQLCMNCLDTKFLNNINWSQLFFFFIDINFRGDTHMTSTLWGVRGEGKNWMLLDIGGGGSKCS